MKQRVISGIVIAAFTIITVLAGGILFQLTATFIAVWGTYEFAKCRQRDINYFEFILMLAAVLLINIFYDKSLAILLSLIVILLTMAVFDENYSFEDTCVSFVEVVLLSFAIHELLHARSIDKFLLGYMIIISYLADMFALFVGMKFGKHKLNERISPKKTIEGAIGGWLLAGIISFIWAAIFNFFELGIGVMAICSLILPIVSQIGDLIFSLIKRHYGVKDFSKLIPGHGGLLDRLDSLTFVLVIFGAISIFVGI